MLNDVIYFHFFFLRQEQQITRKIWIFKYYLEI